MPELEIHHETEHVIDATGQSVGVLAAILAVLLAVVTIGSHRSHTAAIIHKASANDAWQHYQSTRVKYHNLELGENLLAVMGARNRVCRYVDAGGEQEDNRLFFTTALTFAESNNPWVRNQNLNLSDESSVKVHEYQSDGKPNPTVLLSLGPQVLEQKQREHAKKDGRAQDSSQCQSRVSTCCNCARPGHLR